MPVSLSSVSRKSCPGGRFAQRFQGLGRRERPHAEREVVAFLQCAACLLGRADEPVEYDGTGLAGGQFQHDGLEGPDAVQHYGQLPVARQCQLGAEGGQLLLAPGAAGVVEPRLADGLYVRRERAECGNVLFVCVPRVDAGGAELDAPACRAVGVYVDELGSHCDKSTNFK